jgi:hypothetical protein
MRLVEAARSEAARLIKEDPELTKYPTLKAIALRSDERLHME